MHRYLTRILQGILSIALGVGGGCGLFVFIVMLVMKGDSNLKFASTAGLIIGSLVAIVYLVVTTLVDLTTRLYLAKGMSDGIWEIEQTRDLIVDGSIKDVFSACRQALLTVPNVQAVSDDLDNLVTRAKTGNSWRSPGEEMEVEINPLEENKWKLRCVSRPRSKNLIFDYAKNFENVEVWQREFLAIMKGQTSLV